MQFPLLPISVQSNRRRMIPLLLLASSPFHSYVQIRHFLEKKKGSPCINSALSNSTHTHTQKVAQPLSLAIYKEKHTVLPVLPSFMSMSHDATPNTPNTTHHPHRRLVLSGGSKETSDGFLFISRTTTTPFSRPFPGRGPLLPCLFPKWLGSPTAFMSPGKNLDNAIPSRANHKSSILTPTHITDAFTAHSPMIRDILRANSFFEGPESDRCIVTRGYSFAAIFTE